MTKGRFNGLEVDEGQESLYNIDIYTMLKRRIKDDAEAAEELDDDSLDQYHANGKVWASGNDRFGRFIAFDVPSAGFACISPDLSLHLELKKYPHTGEFRAREVDEPEVQEFLLASDGLDTWGTITSSKQYYTLSHAHEHRPSSFFTEGHDSTTYWHIAYCEPFKPNEPTEIVLVNDTYEQLKAYPKLVQAEVEAKLGPVCAHANPVGTCKEAYCGNKRYVPYVPKDK